MTRTFSILAALAIAAALVIHYAEKPINPTAPNLIPAAAESSDASANTDMPHTNPAPASPRESRPADALSHQSTAAPPPASVEAIAFAAAVDTLTSVRATHAEKQAALKQLQDSGRLADAAAELEQRKSADPQNALYPTALGQAYLRLCATTTDVRQQAIWGMTADADFETALNLDPSNWDARFTRAVAMSYWPDTLNKGAGGDPAVQHPHTAAGTAGAAAAVRTNLRVARQTIPENRPIRRRPANLAARRIVVPGRSALQTLLASSTRAAAVICFRCNANNEYTSTR